MSENLKAHLARLSRHAFASFVVELFSANGEVEGRERLEPLKEAGEGVFFQPRLDSYGGSIHDVYIIHCPPLELFDPARDLSLRDPSLVRRLVRIRSLYQGRIGQWGMVSRTLGVTGRCKRWDSYQICSA